MSDQPPRIGVVGAGSWGTAIAGHLAGQGLPTMLWAREPEIVDGIVADRKNPLFLTGTELPQELFVSGDLGAVVAQAEIVVTAIPVPFLRAALAESAGALSAADVVVTVSKGIEPETLMTPHQVIVDLGVAPDRVVALSGPSFAREVAGRLPTAVVAAGTDSDRTHRIQELFATDRFRVYASDDIIGVEIGGALKNVVALAAGVSDGLDLGANARAAIITRGLAEITRLGVALGAHPLTFSGLSGVGDLVLTCTGGLSRNRTVGVAVGEGRTLAEIRSEMTEVAEGVSTCRWARELADRVDVEMPITEQTHRLLFDDKDARQVLRDVLARELRDERNTEPGS